MKPLKIALFHRDNWYRHKRIDGQFAYAVPEFTFEHYIVPKAFQFDLGALSHDIDVAWLDEGKYKGNQLFIPLRGSRSIPVVCHFIYTTLLQHIYWSRVERAKKNADMVLLDYDQIDRFQPYLEIPVRRLAYAVNEKYYFDRGHKRIYDVGFFSIWKYNPERPRLDRWLEGFCKRKGYTYCTNRGRDMKEKYADHLAQCKVVIHLNRNETTRPARIFDVAASRTALLSNPMPEVSGEEFVPYQHYVPFQSPTSSYTEEKRRVAPYTDNDCRQIANGLEYLLDEGHWENVATRAYDYVLKNHTWATRATQLRQVFSEALGL